MSAASSVLPIGEIQLTASGSKSSSSTPTIVYLSVRPSLSFTITVAPNVTLFDGVSGGSTIWTDAKICSNSVTRSLFAFAARSLFSSPRKCFAPRAVM
jgi:hypothetical protein